MWTPEALACCASLSMHFVYHGPTCSEDGFHGHLAVFMSLRLNAGIAAFMSHASTR